MLIVLGGCSSNPSGGGTAGAGGQASADGAVDGAASIVGTPTPGTVWCAGSSSCPALSHPQHNVETESYCCAEGISAACRRMTNLGACESGIPIYCDDTADCDPGLVCCDSDGRNLFSCQASCGDRKQLCQLDAECPSGKRCTGVFTSIYVPPGGAGGNGGGNFEPGFRAGFCQ